MSELIEPLPPQPNGHPGGDVASEELIGHGKFTTHFDQPSLDFSVTETAITSETIAELQSIAARYPQARSALLPMLHLVQSVEGRVTPAGIEACADILGLSTAEVSGVATFYTMYKRHPVGEYHVGVCTTALCAIMGGDEVYARLQDHLGIGNDETTTDGKITLEHVECNAACDFAPVMMVNWEFFDNVTPESATEVVDQIRAGQPVRPTRGARALHLAAGGAGAGRFSRRQGRRRRGRGGSLSAGADHRSGQRLVRPDRWRNLPSKMKTRRTMVDLLTPVLTRELGERAGLEAQQLRRPGRLRGVAHRARHEAGGRGHRGQGLGPPWPRRRRLPDRDEVELHPPGQPEAQVPGGQRRRVRAGYLQGHPADDGLAAHPGRGRDHRRVRHPRQLRLHLRPRRGAARGPATAAGGSRGVRGGLHRDATSSDSGYDLEIIVHAGAGAYICGEETALLDSLEGRRGQPRLRPPFPAIAGLYASPTVINNVESIASVPASSPAVRTGSARWAPRSPRA